MNLRHHIETFLGIGFDPKAHALPSIYATKPKAAPVAQPDNVRHYASGQAYKVEAAIEVDKETGCANVVEWDALLNDKASGKVAGRSPILSATERAAVAAKGFRAETAAAIKKAWADGMSQSNIATVTGFSTDTVKRLTPLFEQ